MNKKDLRIVYMGTPDFAVESLRVLVENDYNVVGVITMPDKPAGRGYKIQFSPIKQYALEKGLPLLQPEKLKDPVFLEELKALNADLQIVVAFRMLPEVVWNMPRFGTFNLHASLLPQYRGAAPINWAVINGDAETGVTTFFLTHEIDTGNIILQEKVAIGESETAGDIHDKLMITGSRLVQKTVDMIIDENVSAMPQPDVMTLKAAPKIFKETCKIDWNQNVSTVYNLIRGLAPYPAAWSFLKTDNGEELNVKIFETEKEPATHTLTCGSIVIESPKQVKVAVIDGFIRLKSIQVAGKKRMSVEDFLRGNKLTEAYKFE
ncbi:methionyl-tRNA formyltransferase [Paludibacter sp.]|uniref:methionyl-tRNA formyltransferase n=1 Tax=Paludibacter sp. TaxID=1898105 RepID=UPI0013539C20|nr:methionyl-tRNA formyltransferase [Paludibacter sp.]MTK54124.1 methionyl-tRNA formyltransferase [Paludibacter sp.]